MSNPKFNITQKMLKNIYMYIFFFLDFGLTAASRSAKFISIRSVVAGGEGAG